MGENETKIKLTFNNSVTNAKKLETYSERLKEIYSLLQAIDRGKGANITFVDVKTQKLKASTNGAKNLAKELGNEFSKAFGIAQMGAFIKSLEVLSNKITNLIKLSASYVENVNLLEVAYSNVNKETGQFNESIESSSKRIEDYIDKMSDLYGLDESRLTRSFGVFKQLANAMELPTETAENLSEIMVKMTNDISSLYNLDLNRASNALQSALVGQVRPIRGATGADITEKTLQKTVDELGLDRSISQLSFVEKRLVMVISLTKQLKNSQGDWARTIESTSNQMRIFQEQWDRLSRAVGNVFYPILEKVFPYLNAILMVLTEIFNLVASMLGFKMPKFDYSSLSSTSDAVLDLEDELNGAGESADKLKQKLSGLRSFDKLNVISSPKDSSTSVSAGGVDPKIMEAFDTAFGKYNDMMDEVNMKARKIRDAILEWLGFTDGTYTNLKIIAGILGTIVGMKIIKGITGIVTGTSTLGKLLGTGGLYKSIKNIITLIKNGTLISTITTKLTSFLKVVSKVAPKLSGIVSVIAGSSGLKKQFKELDASVSKTALHVAELAGGGALIAGPLGALVGGFTALCITLAETDKQLDQLARNQIFGTLNVSTEQWLNILNTGGPQIENLTSKLSALQSELDNTYQSFVANGEQVDLYGLKVSLLGEKVATEDSEKFISAINNMANEATQIITTSGDYNLEVLSGLFERTNGVIDEEEKNILQRVIAGNEARKRDIAEAQNNITTTYDNAIKTRGYLTDEEYNYIKEQLNKIKELTKNEMTKNQTDIEYFKRVSANKNLELDEESYSNFQKALDKYHTEKMDTISENYNIEMNALQNHLNSLGDDETTAREETLKKIKELDEDRKKQEDEVNKYIEDAKNTVLGNLERRLIEATGREKDILKNTFKNLNIDTSEIYKKYADIGKTCAWEFNNQLSKGLENSKITIPKLQGNLDLSNGYSANIGYQYKTYAGGGLPKVGQIFVANERGPELIDEIGGQTFVANQKQISDFMDKRYGQSQQPINLTMPVEIGGERLGTIVINDLQNMAKTNGKPIVIGG